MTIHQIITFPSTSLYIDCYYCYWLLIYDNKSKILFPPSLLLLLYYLSCCCSLCVCVCVCVCVCACWSLFLIRIQYIEWNKLPFCLLVVVDKKEREWCVDNTNPLGRFVVVKGTSTVRVSGLYHTSSKSIWLLYSFVADWLGSLISYIVLLLRSGR